MTNTSVFFCFPTTKFGKCNYFQPISINLTRTEQNKMIFFLIFSYLSGDYFHIFYVFSFTLFSPLSGSNRIKKHLCVSVCVSSP